MPALKDFYRGDTKRYRITFNQDVAGGSLLLTMKRSLEDPDSSAVVQQAGVMDPHDAQGQVFGGYITLDAATTKQITPGEYWVGIQFTNAAGEVATLLAQRIRVKYDVGGSI